MADLVRHPRLTVLIAEEGVDDRPLPIMTRWFLPRVNIDADRYLESKHVVEREPTRFIHESMVAEQSARRIPYQDISARSCSAERLGCEGLVGPDKA
jgi:hypothetical protein